MADVGVRAGNKKFVWTFPGDDEALAAAFRKGEFPFHVHPEWTGPKAAHTGDLRETQRTEMFDRLLEISCATPSSGPQQIKAHLLTLDHDLKWKGPKAR
jgi:hypothetical protein